MRLFAGSLALERWAADGWLFGLRGLGGKQSGHLANHGQDQALVAIRKRGAVLLDFGEESNFVLREFAKHLLSFFVAWSLGAGEEVGE
jgi:hypothetical protein